MQSNEGRLGLEEALSEKINSTFKFKVFIFTNTSRGYFHIILKSLEVWGKKKNKSCTLNFWCIFTVTNMKVMK